MSTEVGPHAVVKSQESVCTGSRSDGSVAVFSAQVIAIYDRSLRVLAFDGHIRLVAVCQYAQQFSCAATSLKRSETYMLSSSKTLMFAHRSQNVLDSHLFFCSWRSEHKEHQLPTALM